MRTIVAAIGAAVVLVANGWPALAQSNLAQPMPMPTVGSELKRGERVSVECWLRSREPKLSELKKCADDAELTNSSSNAYISTPFLAGLDFGMWMSLGIVEQYPGTQDVKAIQSYRRLYWNGYNENAGYAKVTDEDIFVNSTYSQEVKDDVVRWRSHPDVSCPPDEYYCVGRNGQLEKRSQLYPSAGGGKP